MTLPLLSITSMSFTVYHDAPFPIVHTQMNGEILFCNASCERLLQLQSKAFLHKPISALFPSHVHAQLDQMIQDPELLPFIKANIPLTQQTLEIELFVQAQPTGNLFWYFKDHTKYNELLREKERGQTLPRKYGHDINNLLTVIISAAQLIEMDLEENSPFHEDIADITEAAHRAATQTKLFMNIGRQEYIRHKRISLQSFFQTHQDLCMHLFGSTYSAPKMNNDVVIANTNSIEIAIIMSTMHLKKSYPSTQWALSLHDVVLHPPDASQTFGLLSGAYACISISNPEFTQLHSIASSDRYIYHTEAPMLNPVWISMIHCRGTVIQRKTQKGHMAISLYIPLCLDEETL